MVSASENVGLGLCALHDALPKGTQITLLNLSR